MIKGTVTGSSIHLLEFSTSTVEQKCNGLCQIRQKLQTHLTARRISKANVSALLEIPTLMVRSIMQSTLNVFATLMLNDNKFNQLALKICVLHFKSSG